MNTSRPISAGTTIPKNYTLRLLKFIQPFWKESLLSILLSTATMAANIGMLGTSAYLIATAALQPSIAVLQVSIVGVRFFGISRGVFRYLERLVSHSVNFRVLGEIRGWFYKSVEPLVPGAVEDLKSGDLLGRTIQDIESLEDFYVRGIAPPLSAIFVTLGVSLFTLQYSAALAALLASGLLLTGLILSLLVKLFSRDIAFRTIKTRSRISALMLETITASGEILMNNAGDTQIQKIRLASLESQKANLSMAGLHSISLAAGMLIANLTMWGILWLGLPLAQTGQIDGVTLAVLTMITLASFESVNLLPSASAKIETSLAAAKQLFNVTDRPIPVPEPSNSLTIEKFEELQISKLTFAYPGSNVPALKNISLHLFPGKRIVLVGPSGSGKSTLLRLIQHQLEAPKGTIFWNRMDARLYGSTEVRKTQALLSQNAYLFSATLRENLRLANDKVEDDGLFRILQAVGLEAWFQKLPEGLNAWLGENGSLLSGGERQRLLLARALLMKRPILLADEPFANLDMASEREILNLMLSNNADSAIILATHRLVDMEKFDEIFVLNNGIIFQQGIHSDLITRPGLYQDLWEYQNNLFHFDQ